ncbi:MAG: hypothetical protein AAGC67_06005 [Myxococcota bacterium]
MLPILLLSTCLFASQAWAGNQSFSVGWHSTFVNVRTGESQMNGVRVGRVRLDLEQVDASCRESDQAFEGFVRLVPVSRSGTGPVTVECLQRAGEGDMARASTPATDARRTTRR